MRRQRNADATCKRGINEVDMFLAQNPTPYHLEFIRTPTDPFYAGLKFPKCTSISFTAYSILCV